MKSLLQLVFHAVGSPALHSDTAVFVRVGVPGNQRPIFRDTPYNVTLKESAVGGDIVIKVRATDPDGPDSNITYKISNGADNFNVDERFVIGFNKYKIISA